MRKGGEGEREERVNGGREEAGGRERGGEEGRKEKTERRMDGWRKGWMDIGGWEAEEGGMDRGREGGRNGRREGGREGRERREGGVRGGINGQMEEGRGKEGDMEEEGEIE